MVDASWKLLEMALFHYLMNQFFMFYLFTFFFGTKPKGWDPCDSATGNKSRLSYRKEVYSRMKRDTGQRGKKLAPAERGIQGSSLTVRSRLPLVLGSYDS